MHMHWLTMISAERRSKHAYEVSRLEQIVLYAPMAERLGSRMPAWHLIMLLGLPHSAGQ